MENKMAAQALRQLAEKIEAGDVITRDEFEAANTAARTAFDFGKLPEKTTTRSRFDQMNPSERMEFVKSGGRIIEPA
ncbi:MAG: hypothetical protein ACREA2_21880 [Blastocatellia bacterium]